MRSSWKCSFYKNKTKSVNKNFMISPNFVGITVFLHNGKTNVKLKISSYMIGFKFGYFIKTKKNYHGSKSKY